jgi:hypothetical protein
MKKLISWLKGLRLFNPKFVKKDATTTNNTNNTEGK